MTNEFAKLVNRLNNHSATLTVEKLVSRINDLRTGKCKIYQCQIGKPLTQSASDVVEYMSDVEQRHNILLTSTDTNVMHLVLDDILFKLCMAGFSEDNIAERLYAFADAYSAWSAENK